MFQRYKRLIKYTLYKGLIQNLEIRQNYLQKKANNQLQKVNNNNQKVLTPNVSQKYYRNFDKNKNRK
tara:strand:- start:177 stop:377 length:201 start_codon:yes stop_codon:yes gene_type:complete